MKKRSKILVLILVLAFALTGVGYAAWTDQLNINGTVETGNLDVDFVSAVVDLPCLPPITLCPAIAADKYVTKEIEYVDEDTCKVTIGNLYPGARVWFDVIQQNKGSIPVKFDSAEITFEGDPELVKNLKGRASYIAWTNTGSILPESKVFLGGGNLLFPTFENLSDFGTKLTEALQGKQFNKNGWICFSEEGQSEESPSCIWIKLDENAPNDVQDKEVTFYITMHWKQFNE